MVARWRLQLDLNVDILFADLCWNVKHANKMFVQAHKKKEKRGETVIKWKKNVVELLTHSEDKPKDDKLRSSAATSWPQARDLDAHGNNHQE